MDESLIGKIVPVKPFGLEKKTFRENGMFIGSERGEGNNYSINVLYENTFDPADSTHKFALMPENPTFKKIVKELKEGTNLEELEDDLNTILPESLKDMYGAWVIVDMSKRPLVRLYTDNVYTMETVDGTKKPKIVHKAGTPIHKQDPKTHKDLEELAIITQLPVWGFLRKREDGTPIWLKGNDPMVRIEREINQGRLAYVDLVTDFKLEDETTVEEKTEETKKVALEAAPDVTMVG